MLIKKTQLRNRNMPMSLQPLKLLSLAKVENFLGCLSPKDSDGLWKRFERSRVIENEDTSKATEGRNQNARQLLRVWLQGG